MSAHQNEAVRLYDKVANGKEMYAHQAGYLTGLAQVQATLSLAYEQRTANPIAVMALCSSLGRFDTAEKIGETVLERLGLKE